MSYTPLPAPGTAGNVLTSTGANAWVSSPAGGPPSGAASGDLAGTYPSPTIALLAVTDAKVATANKDGVAGTASMRTLGAGAQQATAGNDARLSDSRAPSGLASGDLSGSYPAPTVGNLAITTAKINNQAVTTAKIADGAVDNFKLGNMGTQTFKGRTTAGIAEPEDLSAAQAAAMLPVFTSALKGLAPLSGGGTSNFLRADGTWTAPGGGAPTTAQYVALATDATLTNERVLTGSASVSVTDGGAGLAVTLATIFGVTATTVCVGNDARLSDARTPLAHVHAAADVTTGTMATARLGSGTANATTFLRGDQTWAAPTLAATTVETNLGSTPKWTGKFTITDAAITATSKVLCWQAPGPYTGKGTRADAGEMDPIQVIAVEPAAGSAVVKWVTPMDSGVGPGGISVRRGKVRGNVKFSYSVFS